MRILLDARYLNGSYSGIATYSRELVEALSSIDGENEYVVLIGNGNRVPLHVGPNFKVVKSPIPPVSVQTMTTLAGLVRQYEPTAVHSLFPLTPLRLDIPRVITVHDLQPFIDPDFSGRRARPVQWGYNLFYRYAYPACIRASSWIFCDSHYTRDCVATLMPSQRAKLITLHLGVARRLFERPAQPDIAAVRERRKLPSKYALYYGSTRPNKNLPAMLRAWERVRASGAADDTRLVLIVNKDRFWRSAERHLGDSVIVLDQVGEDDKRCILADAQALFFVTRYEGFGFPALEAMALGVPVLAGDSGSLPEVCGDAALLADPASIEDIAAAMTRILVDATLRATLREAGPLRAATFDWAETARFVRDTYRLVVDNRAYAPAEPAPGLDA